MHRLITLTLVGLAASAAPGLAATETGLATALHKVEPVGNRICMISHRHYRSSGAWPTEKQAMAAAVKAWTNYTTLEYGTAWGSFARSHGKKIDCRKTGSMYACDISSLPCRAK